MTGRQACRWGTAYDASSSQARSSDAGCGRTKTRAAMDKLSPEKRSWLMSLVKSKDTKPEMIVRRIVYRLGFRYRLHETKLPGSPDLVFAGRQSVIFVHGCFWHQHEGCRRARRPETRAAYWAGKLDGNIERDGRNRNQLKGLGWRVLTIWECQLQDPQRVSRRISKFLIASIVGKSA